MKQLFTFLLMVCAILHGEAQIYLTETFESAWSGSGATAAPSGWTQKAGVVGQTEKYWDRCTWTGSEWTPAGNGTYKPNGAVHGTGVAHYTNFGATYDQTDSLISWAVDLSTASNPVIEFSYAFPNDSWYGSLKLLICKPGVQWELIGNYTFTGTNTDWTNKITDIPDSYNVAGVKIAFVVVAGAGSNADLWLDAITVREGIKPIAPTNLSFDNATSKQLILNWTDNADNETSYLIYRSTDGINYSLITTLPANSITYTNTTLAWTTVYYYKVYAVAEAWSDALSGYATTKAGTMSGNYTVGVGEDYQKISTALSNVSYYGFSGPVTLTLTGNYDETSETTLNLVNIGASEPNTITITDGDPGNNDFYHATSIVVKLNGAQYYILDGLTIAAGSNIALQITNDASHNTIQNCTIKSNVTNTVYGVVTITAGSVKGNDYNTIKNCNIGPNTSNPLNGIYAETCNPGIENNNNAIEGCHIYDFYHASISSSGIYIKNYNTDFAITGCSFFQTGTRTSTGNVVYYSINIESTSGNNFTITNNFIGGTAAECGGSAWTMTGSNGCKFSCIRVSAGNTLPSNLHGNTIKNIDFTTTSPGTTGQPIASGIHIVRGDYNIGTVSGNTIGSVSSNNSFKVTGGLEQGYPWFIAIMAYPDAYPGNISICNNIIGGLTGLCSSVTSRAVVKAIWTYGSSLNNVFTISGNTIGGIGGNGKISVGDENSTTPAHEVYGIDHWAAGTSTLGSNTIRSLVAHSQTGATNTYGIKNQKAMIVESNSIYNLSGINSAADIYGINSSINGCTIKNNMVRLGYLEDGSNLINANLHGIYEGGGNVKIFHNNVFVGGTGVNSGFSCAFAGGYSGDIVKNNIFVNARSNGAGTDKHYSYFVANISDLDYNIAFATGTDGWIGCTSGVDRNWTDWQGLGLDIHGLNVDPFFVNATGAEPDLHLLSGSPADLVGLSGLDISMDYDNEERSLLSPVDIGADAGIFSPLFVTDSVFDVWYFNACCRMTVLHDGGSNITSCGICWSTNSNPTLADTHTTRESALSSSTNFMPDLSMATRYYVRSYVINGNGTYYGNQIEFYTDFAASVSGDWDNPATWGGSVPAPGANVEIGYGLTITIPSGKSSYECNNIILNPTSKLNVEGSLHVHGYFRSFADNSGSGSVIDNGTLNIDGEKTILVYIALSDRYYYITVPVTGVKASVFGNIGTTELVYYRNTAGSSWERITDPNTELVPGTGYAVKLTGAPKTVAFSGNSLITGAFNPTILNLGDSWNLIGNPYPSAIDWGTENDPAGWIFNNIRNTIYVKNGATFAIWNGAEDGEALNGGSRYIKSNQSFWIKVIGESPSAGMNNLIRVHSDGTILKSNSDISQKLRVKVARDGFTDQALLKFHANAETWVDKLDAEKMFATDAAYPQLYMTVENEKQAIASQPLFSGVYHQPLAFKTDVAGQFTFTFTEMESFGAATEIYIEDKAANKMVNLNRNSVYAFESGICDTENRFVIHIADGTTHFNPFDYPGTTGIDGLGVNVNVYGHQNSIFVKAEKAIIATVKVYNLLGAEVASVEMNGDFAKIDMTAKGHYVVKVLGSKISKVEKVNIE